MADKTIEIPAIQLEEMVVTIKGTTPLLTSRFSERARKAIEDKQTKVAGGAKGARQPKAEFEDAMYVIDKKGSRFGFPSAGVKKALVSAGGRFTDQHMTVLRGLISIKADLIEIHGPAPTMRTDWGRLSNGTMNLIYRPMFTPWTMDVPVQYIVSMLSRSQLLNLFQIAGFSIGIGAWRAEKNGSFGHFELGEVQATT